MVELVPTLLRQELARLAEDDLRLDGRGRWEGREVSLETDCLYNAEGSAKVCLLYTSPSPRDRQKSRMPSSA